MQNLDAAIWTALPPKFNKEEFKIASEEDVLSYLKGLDTNARYIAEEYVRKTPVQIDTKYRRAIEKEFGWIPYKKN